MRVVAAVDPALFREVHAFACAAFPETTKYYHVAADPAKIPALDALADDALPALFARDDERQLIHVTYGQILGAKNADGSFCFKDRLYRLLRENDALYARALDAHLTRHLALLYRDIPKQGS